MGKLFLNAVLVLLVAVASPAWVMADESRAPDAASTQTTSDWLAEFQKNLRASYTFELIGPYLESLSGNIRQVESNGDITNTGDDITITHYLAVGYKLDSNWSIGVTQPFVLHIDEVAQPEENSKEILDPTKSNFRSLDPYVTLTNSKILAFEPAGFAMDGLVRYYIPISPGTKFSADGSSDFVRNSEKGAKRTESAHGALRFLINPNFSFAEKFNLGLTSFVTFKFAKRSDEDRKRLLTKLNDGSAGVSGSREDFQLVFDPSLSYSVASNIDLAVDVSLPRLRHYTNTVQAEKVWLSDAADGAYGTIWTAGVSWQAVKTLNINPQLSWSGHRRLSNTEIGLTAKYTFF